MDVNKEWGETNILFEILIFFILKNLNLVLNSCDSSRGVYFTILIPTCTYIKS